MSELFSRFAPMIAAASDADLTTDVSLGGRLILDRIGALVVCYAPFEHVQRSARVVIVGITPGEQQASNALLSARKHLLQGSDDCLVLAAAKVFASFSGPMRSNLIAMLDHIGLHRWLGISSTASLWGDHDRLVHFTSALRYPVYVNGKNYSGQPSMVDSPMLRRLLDSCLREEVQALPDAVWVPLGPKATQGLGWLVGQGALQRQQVLEGLPHPSGANGERIAYFLGRKPREALSSRPTQLLLISLANDCWPKCQSWAHRWRYPLRSTSLAPVAPVVLTRDTPSPR